MKKSVNLILKQFKEPPFLRKLRVILPILAGITLTLFVIFFLISVHYVNNNTYQYNAVKKEVDIIEQKIIAQKNVEGIYTLTFSRLNVLNEILASASRKDFSKLVAEVDSLQQEGINLVSTSVDENSNVLLSLTVSSSGELDRLVDLLIDKEQQGFFSDIEASGIVREKDGSYILSVSFHERK